MRLTDGQTDRQLSHRRPRLHSMQRGKNNIEIFLHYINIDIFVLGYLILDHPLKMLLYI